MKEINIALIGLGNVGRGVVKILEKSAALIQDRTSYKINLETIVVRNKLKVSEDYKKYNLTEDLDEVLSDKSVDVVIELIGGYEPAYSYMLKVLNAKKHLITANKAVISRYSAELFEAARKNNVNIGFEGAVAGCIPIIRSLKDALIADNIRAIYGILNGTTNFILTRMAKNGWNYEKALKAAQEKGFAEANPDFDVLGNDAAQKLAVLASIAYSTKIDESKIYTEGITGLSIEDIKFAANWGYTIKLLAIAKEKNNKLDLRVHPTMVSASNLLSSVDNELNAIYVVSDNAKSQMYYGKGAGQLPTASAVVSNIIDVVKDSTYLNFSKTVDYLSIDGLYTKYYLRFMVVDKPGVLHNISGVLAKNDISIEEVMQVGRKEVVPLVIKTHQSYEKNVQKAIAEIDALDVIKDKSVVIRIEE